MRNAATCNGLRFRPSVPSAILLDVITVRVSRKEAHRIRDLALHTSPHIPHNDPLFNAVRTHEVRTTDSRGIMASIIKHKSGWRALVKRGDFRKSKVFTSKTQAREWAARIEYELSEGKPEIDSKKSVSDLLARYRDEVSPRKRSHKWEHNKLNHLIDLIGSVSLADLDAPRMAKWRDDRLETVGSATVNREWNLLSVVFNTAIKEWKWLTFNPLSDVKRPIQPPSRERLITAQEIALIEHTTGFVDCPSTVSSRVGAAFLFAIETAMRAGEIVSIKPDLVDLANRTCLLPMTKNGSRRTVPLSARAIEILKLVECDFNLTSRQIDANFRKAKKQAGIDGLHFHDSRHQAITNLAQKVEVLDLARITGIKDLKILMVYYNKSAKDIAKLL